MKGEKEGEGKKEGRLQLLSCLCVRLNDTRAQKVKYSRLAREKEEEIGMATLTTCVVLHVHVHVHST